MLFDELFEDRDEEPHGQLKPGAFEYTVPLLPPGVNPECLVVFSSVEGQE